MASARRFLHGGLAALVAVPFAAAAPVSAQDAPMFRGGARHTGVYASPGVPKLHGVAWTLRTGGRIFSSPAVANGIVYVGSTDGSLYAADARTGAPRWKLATGARVTSSPAVSAGAVYFTSYDGKLYALDAATGKRRWTFTTGGEHRFTATHLHGALPAAEAMPDPYDVFLSSPAVAGGVVYFGSGDGNVYALGAAAGDVKWKFHTGDVVHASPAVANGTVYIGSWDSYFYALDAATGALRWRFKTGEDADIHNQVGIQSSAAVVNGVVYFGCRDAHVYAVDAATGRKKWSFATKDGAWASSSPAVSNGRLYFGDGSSHTFHALDTRTGAQTYAIDFARGFFSSAAVAGAVLYMGNLDGAVTALDLRTRKTAWSFSTPAARAANAAYGRKMARLRASRPPDFPFYDNMVIRFDEALTGSIWASPVVAGSTVYVGSTDGNLYALR